MARRALYPAAAALAAVVLLWALGVVRGPAFLLGGDAGPPGGGAPTAFEDEDVGADDPEDGDLPGLAAAPPRPAAGAGPSVLGPVPPAGEGPARPGGLDGVVKRADGTAAAHARITAVDAAGIPVVAIADADGRFHLDIPPGRYDLILSAGRDGALVRRGLLLERGAKSLSLTLAGGSELRVEATRAGAPASGLAVRALLRFDGADAAVAEGTTDVGGVFVADAVPAGPYTVEATDAAGVAFSKALEIAGTATVAFSLPGTVRLEGAVYDAESKLPLEADVVATVQMGDGLVARAATRSGLDGRYGLDLPVGRVRRLVVQHPEYAPYTAGFDLSSGKPAVRDAPLRRGAGVRGVATIAGTKTPLPNLSLRFEQGEGVARSATTGPDGAYEVHGLGRGVARVLVETPGWYLTPGKDRVNIPRPVGDPPVVPFDLEVASAGSVSGLVVDGLGAPVGGARVWLSSGGGATRGARRAGRELETTTAADGAFSLDDVPPDAWLQVRASLGDAEAPASAGFRVADGPVPPVRLTLSSTGRISGRVTELVSRAPVGGATVHVDPVGDPPGRTSRWVLVDADGRFVAGSLLAGRWRLTPQKAGYLVAAGTEVDVVVEGPDARTPETALVLDAGLVVGGEAVDSTGRPVAGARVRVRGAEDEPAPGTTPKANANVIRDGRTDASGAWRLTGFRRGAYVLEVRAPGFATATMERLRGGEERLRVVMEPTASRPSGR